MYNMYYLYEYAKQMMSLAERHGDSQTHTYSTIRFLSCIQYSIAYKLVFTYLSTVIKSYTVCYTYTGDMTVYHFQTDLKNLQF